MNRFIKCTSQHGVKILINPDTIAMILEKGPNNEKGVCIYFQGEEDPLTITESFSWLESELEFWTAMKNR